MAMTREQMDEFDRIMMGMPARQAGNAPVRAMTPTPESMDPMLRPEGTAGGPVVSYSLDDIRRFLGMGGRPAMSPAEAADAAQMYERLPNAALPPTPPGDYDAPSPSIPYMPSIDPRGAAAPIPAPPRPASPPRPRLPVMRGLPTDESQFVPARPDSLGGVSPADMAAMGQVAPPINRPARPVMAAPVDTIGPPPANPPLRAPQDLARALQLQVERERAAGMRAQPLTAADIERLNQRGFGVRAP